MVHIPPLRKALLVFLVLLTPLLSRGQQPAIGLENQVVGQTTVNFDDPLPYQFGLRYIPTLDLSKEFRNDRMLDAEVSLNGYGNAFFNGFKYDTAAYAVDLYRTIALGQILNTQTWR